MSKVHPLKDNQKLAVDPADSVWLSASAGTGKTQVLSARVLRLLLEPGVRPEQILCLTFTKAGAAEMATRVNEVLANWVRMSDTELGAQLGFIGAKMDAGTIARARSLFAYVLDCPGGGLRIDTIHAFAQWLLAAFPEEAGLVPGTKAMEDRDRELLARRVLSAQLLEWETSDPAAVAALEMLTLRLAPDRAREWLMRCANAREAWFGPGAWTPPMRGRVMGLLGLAEDTTPASLAALCGEGAFDTAALRQWLAAHRAWGTKTALDCLEVGASWLGGDADARLAACDDLRKSLFTQKDEPRALASLTKFDPQVGDAVDRVRACLDVVRDQRIMLELAAMLTPALELGRKFALAWDEAKAREGLVDFDDLIRRAAALLQKSDLSQWIRYKLDRQFDHVLIDEAQDTNPDQWAIINALTDDFFSGLGAAGDKQRTIFVVGDYKQAIFGFQGTSPENFASARDRYEKLLSERKSAADGLRDAHISARDLQDLGLGRSYRTAQEVLSFVDEAIGAIGHKAFGLPNAPDPHIGDDRPGLVTLWQPVPGKPEDEDEGEDAQADSGPELRVTAPDRRMADRIAAQISQWLHNGFPLVKGEHRNARAGDIMVLVRKRRELAGLIVARLYAAGVPVAGVDRLRLGAPLAVKDLMAALRFAAQPGDDLSLACLLVSPLIGWTQEQLLEHGYRGEKVGLWSHLRDSTHPDAELAVAALLDLLARADFEPPQALLHWLLVGPWQGKRKLLARLGREAEDPIAELLNAALQFAAANTPSLQGFIRWFDAGEGELKRDAEGPGGFVRVMTVHGAKGLQAPIVILADACGNPDKSPAGGLVLVEDLPGGDGREIPLLPLSKAERVGRIADASAARDLIEREEHWRLLYVAMTRAEEALFIGGALGKSEKAPAPDSWYARLAPLFPDALDDLDWGARQERGHGAPPFLSRTQAELAIPPVLPAWARMPIGPEPRPPRPLAPSASAEDQAADPPLPAALAAVAARRGVLIHALLERLPDVPNDLRAAGGRAWLARHAADLAEAERDDMLARALAVLDEPQFRDLFGPTALAEVPLAATVGTQVIAGTIDRLLVEETRILVADFKTARRPPAGLEQVPLATLRQMAAYVAALEVIFPGRMVEAAVLYTQVPRLIALPAALLNAHKPGFADMQESYSG